MKEIVKLLALAALLISSVACKKEDNKLNGKDDNKPDVVALKYVKSLAHIDNEVSVYQRMDFEYDGDNNLVSITSIGAEDYDGNLPTEYDFEEKFTVTGTPESGSVVIEYNDPSDPDNAEKLSITFNSQGYIAKVDTYGHVLGETELSLISTETFTYTGDYITEKVMTTHQDDAPFKQVKDEYTWNDGNLIEVLRTSTMADGTDGEEQKMQFTYSSKMTPATNITPSGMVMSAEISDISLPTVWFGKSSKNLPREQSTYYKLPGDSDWSPLDDNNIQMYSYDLSDDNSIEAFNTTTKYYSETVGSAKSMYTQLFTYL